MNILITGGTGFLGSRLAAALSAQHRVTVLARSRSLLTRLDNCRERIGIVKCDNVTELAALVQRTAPDCIIHTACNYGRRGESLTEIAAVNLHFALGVLESASGAGAHSFINTDTSLDKYLNGYTLSKRQFAEWGQWLAGQQRIRFVNARLEHMYGPGDDPSRFTAHVIRSCVENAAALDLTTGEQRRDFIHIDDTVQAYRTLLDSLDQLDDFEQIAIGTGQAVSVREFAETVRRLSGSRTELRFGALAYRDNEPMLCVADTARLRSLGWQPRHDLASGLLHTLRAERDA